MRYCEVIASLRAEGEHWVADAPAEWSQGRTLFGGLQAALLVAAMRRHIPADVPLRSLQTSFVGPVLPGLMRIQVQVLRQGKSAIHVQAHSYSDEGVGCTAVAVFGRARPSSLQFQPPYPVVACKPEQARKQPYIPGVLPAFLQFVEQAWAAGGFPGSGAAEPRTQIYVRYPEEPVSESLVIAVADTIPSPAISMLKSFAVASSMCWTLEFMDDDFATIPEGHWLMDAQATAARDGYVYQTATLWSPDQRPIALSRQSAVVFA
ncbi:MAG: thioesterase family protein [Panacagrimonas sp.]